MNIRYASIGFLLLAPISSCQNNTNPPAGNMQTEIHSMTERISDDLSTKGPKAWTDHFENSPGFFMASEGQRIFPGYDSANHFINDILAKNIRVVHLKWSNIHIDSLSPNLAALSAEVHEQLVDNANNTIPFDGYFTGIVEKTAGEWKFRNLHWSAVKH